MSRPPQRPYLHLVPIEPGECLPSWVLRIAARNGPNFRRFSSTWFLDEMRVTPGFDAFPAASLLIQLGAINPSELDHYITHHTLLGTTKCFYTQPEWKALIDTHGAEGSRIYALRRKAKQRSWHICPACRQLELEQGIATWQVLPQIPGILFCARHEMPLTLTTSTRIPPLAAPAEGDILLGQEGPSAASLGREEDHLTLARDISAALAVGLNCVRPDQSLRDALALPLFGMPWSRRIEIWPVLVARFGEPFLDAVQVRSYHQKQICLGRLHPSFHGVVYLALLARVFGATLRDLLVTAR